MLGVSRFVRMNSVSVTKSGGGQAPQIVLTLTQFILTNLLTRSMTSAGLAENQQAWPVILLTLLSTEQYDVDGEFYNEIYDGIYGGKKGY